MRKENAIQNYVIVILAIVILVMSVGYALYTQPLTINGTAHVAAAKWQVEFDENTRNHSLLGDATVTSESVSGTTASYEISLAKPGDQYTLETRVHNAGTIDAKLVRITLGGLTDVQKKYIAYTITYDGVTYSSSTDGLTLALAAGEYKNVSVTVKYGLPTEASDLPTTAVDVSLTATLNYESVA